MSLTDRKHSSAARWAVWRGGADLVSQFRREWNAIPEAAYWRWLWTLAGGFAVSCLVVIVVTLVARGSADRLNQWDREGLIWVEQRSPLSFADAILLESPGNLVYLVPLTLVAAGMAVRRGRPLLAVSLVGGYLLQRPIVLIGWSLWERARPDMIAGGIAAPQLHSFPSGHVALALVVYGQLAWVWFEASRSRIERGVIVVGAILFVLAIGTARVRLGAHWPSDIISGMVVGSVWTLSIIFALRRAEAAGGR